jgi:glycerol-3-phosphate acyltransferase PlsY
MMFILDILFIAIAYLIGSLNSAILVCKVMKLADPRIEGSGNPGATNVLRIAGKKAATIVLVGDMLKGFLPVLCAHILGVSDFALACVALAAVIGHMYPVFFKFQGGKGVATAFGAILALSFWIGLLAAIVWGVVVFVTKYVSLASLIAMVFAAVLILFAHTAYFLPIVVMIVLVGWRHKENIDRLKLGTENKIEW